MKAAYFRELGRLSLEETAVPEPEGDEVQVKVRINTICGATDTEILQGLRRHKQNIILGHESGGTVTKTGGRVTEFQVGQRVASEAWGAFADYLIAREEEIQPVPDHMSWDEVAMAELLLKVYQMSARNIKPGDTVVILGQGAAGLLFTQMARLMGASRIIVSDLYDFKLKKAEAYGADYTVNAVKEDVLKRIAEYSDGRGAEVVIEAAGRKATVEQAPYTACEYGATILQFGVTAEEVKYNFMRTHDLGQTILTIGSCRFADPREPFRMAVRLIAEKKIEVASFITHRFDFKDLNRAFDKLREQPEDVIKVAVDF